MIERKKHRPNEAEGRQAALRKYTEAKELVSTSGVSLFVNRDTVATVVIPAFKEEARIGNLLQSLSQVTKPVQVLVVDDIRSEDAMERVVTSFPDSSVLTTHYMCYSEAGRDRALRGGLDEVVVQYLEKNITTPHSLVFMDADTLAQPGWIETIDASLQRGSADVVAGTFAYPEEFDRQIENAIGYSHFFRRFNTFTDYFLRNGGAPIRIVGSNTAIDLVHYARVGGYTGIEGEHGELMPGTEDVFAEQLKRVGSTLEYCPVSTIVSPRRLLKSMINRVDPMAAYANGAYVRDDDEGLVSESSRTLTGDDFHNEVLERLGMFFVHRVVNPAIRCETNAEVVAGLIGTDHPVSQFIQRRLGGDVVQPEEAIQMRTIYLGGIIDSILAK